MESLLWDGVVPLLNAQPPISIMNEVDCSPAALSGERAQKRFAPVPRVWGGEGGGGGRRRRGHRRDAGPLNH